MTDKQVRTFSWAPPTLWTCPRCGTVILLGWKQVPIHIVPLKEIARGEFHENAVRLDFLPSELPAIMQAVGPAERQAAKARQTAGLKRGQKPPRSGKFPEREKGQARDMVARYVGVSGRTLEKAVEVVEAAEADPSLATKDATPRCSRCGYVEGA